MLMGFRCTLSFQKQNRLLAGFFIACLPWNGSRSASKKTDLRKRAGDEIRTRDSLLGRQGAAFSPPACYEVALQALLQGAHSL